MLISVGKSINALNCWNLSNHDGPRGSDAKEHSSRSTKIYSLREYSLLLNSSYFLIYLFLQLVIVIDYLSMYTTEDISADLL